MDKANVVHIDNVIIFSCKEINPGICRKMGDYESILANKMIQFRKQKPYDLPLMWVLTHVYMCVYKGWIRPKKLEKRPGKGKIDVEEGWE